MGNISDLLTVVLGFSAIIFVHELGHFIVARWAGVRVLAFALGFGPALVSYRKGMGVRTGTSEPAYRKMAREQGDGRGLVPGVSPTEYRLNVFPLGGYVKMLGQDDADPSHRSEQPDSYNSVSIPKRMAIISAGVVMNLLTAALMFVVVFYVGLKAESPQLGPIAPGSPAAKAVAVGHAGPDGLRAGDVVVAINGEQVEAFKDITLAVAMSRRDAAMEIEVLRGEDRLRFKATPRVDRVSNMLALGLQPASSGTIARGINEEELRRAGLPAGVVPGMRLAGGLTASGLDEKFAGSNGEGVEVVFEGDGGGVSIAGTLRGQAEFEVARVSRADGTMVPFVHLMGLVPVMRVGRVEERAASAGLREGDIFARLGEIDWPGVEEGTRQIRGTTGPTINAEVLRAGKDGVPERVVLKEIPVRDGTIGFYPQAIPAEGGQGGGLPALILARWPRGSVTDGKGEPVAVPGSALVGLLPGSMVVGVDGTPATTMTQVRGALQAAARAGREQVEVSVKLPDAAGTIESRKIELTALDRERLLALGWSSPLDALIFEQKQVLLRRSTPMGAIAKGVQETHKMVLTTYLTFARLFQGSVKIEHLKGPIGIAHVGTLIAERGWIWLLFFMAALSINLAVVNFLPLPIVDGGHFVFLCYEAITGKPVSVAVQNAATIAGLVLIGSVFLITTYQDLMNLIR